jgi:hypothetical protein
VRVAYDFDGDGTFDTIEYLDDSDLEAARARSRDRLRSADRMTDTSVQVRTSRPSQFSGQITEIYTSDVGMDQPQVVARVYTPEGDKSIVLGPQNKITTLQLREGDEVTIFGTPRMISNRQMVVADRIQSQGRTVVVTGSDRPSTDSAPHWVNAEVLSTSTATFRHDDLRHLIARVRLDDGRVRPVDLGPADRYWGVDLSPGENISILANSATINEEPGLVAESVRSANRNVDLQRSLNLTDFQTKDAPRQTEWTGRAIDRR